MSLSKYINPGQATILMDDLAHIYNTFEGILNRFGMVYIAGGAVRDTLLGRNPRDYDIFILIDEKNFIREEVGNQLQRSTIYKGPLASLKDDISECLRLMGFSNGGDQIKITKDYHGLVENITYKTKSGNDATVQIIISTAPSVYGLLEDFDWNICLFSYGWMPHSEKIEVYNPCPITDLEPGKPLKVNNPIFPYRALRRGYKFGERYNLKLSGHDMQCLCKRILDKDLNDGEESEGKIFDNMIKSKFEKVLDEAK